MSLLQKLKKVRTLGLWNCIKIVWNYKVARVIRRGVLKFAGSLPLQDIIVIESHNDFDCNGGAFYDYLIQNGYHQRYKIVWLLKNKKPKGLNLPRNVETYPLRGPSIVRDYYICRAKYVTADNEGAFKMRDDQISIYFGHGPFILKNVKSFMPIPVELDYILSGSPNCDQVLCEQMSLPYPNRKLIHLGYPMHDIFYKPTENEIRKFYRKPYSHAVLWMPTFRRGGGIGRNDSYEEYPLEVPLIQTIGQLKRLSNLLNELGTLLIIKLHPMQEIDANSELFSLQEDKIVILTGNDMKKYGVDNYRLLKDADALISDYSSIAFSYILLNRPMAFVLSDMNDMKHGFSVDNLEFFMAGDKIYSLGDMEQFIRSVSVGEDHYSAQRQELCNWMYQYQDGNSCQRIAELLKL